MPSAKYKGKTTLNAKCRKCQMLCKVRQFLSMVWQHFQKQANPCESLTRLTSLDTMGSQPDASSNIGIDNREMAQLGLPLQNLDECIKLC